MFVDGRVRRDDYPARVAHPRPAQRGPARKYFAYGVPASFFATRRDKSSDDQRRDPRYLTRTTCVALSRALPLVSPCVSA